MVTVLEGKGRFTVGGEIFILEEGEKLIILIIRAKENSEFSCFNNSEKQCKNSVILMDYTHPFEYNNI